MKQFKLSIIITVLMSMTGLQALADWDTATKIQVDGLYYYLDEANQQAQVTSMPSGKYTGEIEIPSSFTYNETTYSVTFIGGKAFSLCSDLNSVTIPNSVTSIGWEAFSGCSNLTSVTVYRTSPVAISNSVFTNRTNATLYVPKGSKSAYQAVDYWKEFKEIIELEATGIKTIDLSLTPDSSPKDEGSEYWYDLQGHRIVNPSNGQLPKGIYIHQGKKIVVK